MKIIKYIINLPIIIALNYTRNLRTQIGCAIVNGVFNCIESEPHNPSGVIITECPVYCLNVNNTNIIGCPIECIKFFKKNIP